MRCITACLLAVTALCMDKLASRTRLSACAGLLPFGTRQWASLTFWVCWTAAIGAVGLFIGGVCQWNKLHILSTSGMRAVQLYRALPYLVFGSLLLDVSSFLSLIELSNQ